MSRFPAYSLCKSDEEATSPVWYGSKKAFPQILTKCLSLAISTSIIFLFYYYQFFFYLPGFCSLQSNLWKTMRSEYKTPVFSVSVKTHPWDNKLSSNQSRVFWLIESWIPSYKVLAHTSHQQFIVFQISADVETFWLNNPFWEHRHDGSLTTSVCGATDGSAFPPVSLKKASDVTSSWKKTIIYTQLTQNSKDWSTSATNIRTIKLPFHCS